MRYSIQMFSNIDFQGKNAEDTEALERKLIEFGAEGELIKEFATKEDAEAYFNEFYKGENIPDENKPRTRQLQTFAKGNGYFRAEFFGVVETTETEDEEEEEFSCGPLYLWHNKENEANFLYDSLFYGE